MEKLHHELSRHKDFIKGTDKRLWAVQFGIRHYAGTVTYSVKNFLEKNKDVQQELFFDYLEKSSCEFVKGITEYRVCVSHTLATPLATPTSHTLKTCPLLHVFVQDLLTTYLESARSKATKSKGLMSSGTKTAKGKPTVGDTFRTQLLALVDVLDSTTPW